MTQLKVITELNRLSVDHFPLRKLRPFTVNITLSYEQVEEVDTLSVQASILYEKEEWADDEIAQLTAESAIALMASRMKMERKAPIANLILRWVPLVNIEKEVTASVLQSLFVPDVHFHDVYAIRISIWNYLYKEGLKEGSTITILPTGKIELQPRDVERFEGNEVDEYKFKIGEMKSMSRGPHMTWFRAMERYDYTIFPEGELQEPISKRAPPSGFAAAMAAQPKNYMGSNMSMSEYYQKQIEENKKKYIPSDAHANNNFVPMSLIKVETDEKTSSSDTDEDYEESDKQDDPDSTDSGVPDSSDNSLTGFDSAANGVF